MKYVYMVEVEVQSLIPGGDTYLYGIYSSKKLATEAFDKVKARYGKKLIFLRKVTLNVSRSNPETIKFGA